MVNFAQQPVFTILDQLPSILFFSTYTLLILFWAEIIHHARNQSLSFPQKLRPIFISTNMVVYLILIGFWLLLFFFPLNADIIDVVANIFLAGISLVAAIGFVIYGGWLYVMLKRFPIDSIGRKSKLKEVGWVTVICTTCFTVRAGLIVYGTLVNVDAEYYFVGTYFLLVEILPSFLVLWILRKIPPKKTDMANENYRNVEKSNLLNDVVN